MRKASLFAVSFFIILLGVQSLLIEKVVFHTDVSKPTSDQAEAEKSTPFTFTNSPAFSWSLITLGGCMTFYIWSQK